MVCTTIKEGTDCFFMTNNGCQFNGGSCHTIIEKCEGCQKIADLSTGQYCLSFPDPAMRWRIGTCSMASHAKVSISKGNGKLNPLKSSKRRAG